MNYAEARALIQSGDVIFRSHKPLLSTAEMAHYLGLDARTANQWEMSQGPIRPTTETIDGQVWIRWRTEDVRRLAAAR